MTHHIESLEDKVSVSRHFIEDQGSRKTLGYKPPCSSTTQPCVSILSYTSDTGSRSTSSETSYDLDSDMKRNIAELEKRIAAIDLSVSSTQRTLEDIYRYKTDPIVNRNLSSKSLFLRRTRSFLGFIGCRSVPTNSQRRLKSSSSPALLDDAITQTEDTLQRLIEERQGLTLDLVHRKGELTSRHEKLPVELWARIFLLCLPDEEFITPDPRQAPLLLCQICSGWRNIAISTPFLWNALAIRSSWRRYIWKSSLKTWLQRSSKASLYLDISIAIDKELSSVEHHVFMSIMATSDRWRHLRLNIPNNLLLPVLRRKMPRLQTLEFSSKEYILNIRIHPYQAPKLRTISFLTKVVYLHGQVLPWKQLTHLASHCWLNISQHAEILSNCPNLQSYSMSLIHMPWDAPWVDQAKKILHPRMQILKIIIFVDNSLDPTIDFHLFQLPNLSELTLVIPDESPAYGVLSWPKTEILSLIQRSSCSLTKLHFRGISLTPNDISSIQKLINLPNLVHVQGPSITFFA